MKRTTGLLLCLGLAATGLSAGSKPGPSVRWAPSWHEAVEEAQALNLPLIVHRHGFYWGPCWTMHRSVLQNRNYIRFAEKHTVEVISMEETDRALRSKSPHVRTYPQKDPYGEKLEYLVEFPGLTIDQLQDLSNGPAIDYMEGGRIPYTAIVDPHSLKEMEGIKGTRTVAQLTKAITRHEKALKVKYGEGIKRDLWNRVGKGEVQVDMMLAEGRIADAMGVWRYLGEISVLQPDVLKRRVESVKESILESAAKRLDEIETLTKDGQGRKLNKLKREVEKLSRALQDTPLEERAYALLVELKKK